MLSLAMIVKNEEKYLDRCLKSAIPLVGEMIVVDTGSTDRTREIARDNGAKIFDFAWCDDFSAARNFAMNQTSGDWILVLDADEYFEKDYSEALNEFMKNKEQVGELEVISKVGKDGIVQYSRTWIPRLFPRHIRYEGIIHEQPQTGGLPLRSVAEVQIMHDGYYNVVKSTRNLPLLFKILKENPNNSYILYQLGKEYCSNEDFENAAHYLFQAYRNLTGKESYTKLAIVILIDALNKTKNYEAALQIVKAHADYLQDIPDFHFARSELFLDYALASGDFSVVGEIEKGYLKCLELGGNETDTGAAIGVSSYMAAHNLAVFYETTGNLAKAIEYYSLAADEHKYQPSMERLEALRND